MHRNVDHSALRLNIISLDRVRVIIVVVTYNCERYVDYIMGSLKEQLYDFSKVLFMVIDNASRDGTLSKMLSQLQKLDKLNWLIVRLPKNYGFVLANNVALHLARKLLGDLNDRTVIFLNPDTRILNKNFLQQAESLTRVLPIVGFAMVSGNGETVDSLGAYVDYLGNPQDILCGVKVSSRLVKLIGRLPLLYSVPYVCFAATAVRGDVLESLGFLRPFYIIYFEDTEFCLRAWSEGIPVLAYREFMVWHARGGTQASMQRNKSIEVKGSELDILYHFSKNSLLLTYEYLGVVKFLVRSLLYLLISILFKRKHLIRAVCGSLRIIVQKRIKPKRLPKGLILFNPQTWVFLWALKCFLQKPSTSSLQDCITYGVQRASLEYIRYRFFSKMQT